MTQELIDEARALVNHQAVDKGTWIRARQVLRALADELTRNGEAKERLLTAASVADRLGCSVRTIWRMLRAGKLPQPIRYNRKLVRWRESEVNRAIEEGKVS